MKTKKLHEYNTRGSGKIHMKQVTTRKQKCCEVKNKLPAETSQNIANFQDRNIHIYYPLIFD